MFAPYPANRLHNQHPPPPAQNKAGSPAAQDSGGQICTPKHNQGGIPPTKNLKQPIDYDKALYKRRHKIENMFAKPKDWRRIAMRYDCCAHTFFSAVCLAATVLILPVTNES
jgi:transposase